MNDLPQVDAIPDYLQRKKGANMSEEAEQKQASAQEEAELTLDQVMDRIKTMTTQRDKLNEAITAHKKMARRMIGRL